MVLNMSTQNSRFKEKDLQINNLIKKVTEKFAKTSKYLINH